MDREQRLLPRRTLRAIGAWCILDHYGPDVVSRGPGMRVPPHPHIGLSGGTTKRAPESARLLGE